MRRWLSRLNVGLTIVLLGCLFIFVNFIASRRYTRVDLTSSKVSTLSEKTIQLLKQLTEPVTIAVFYQPQTPDGRPNPLYPLITDLLKEYERYSNQLTVDYVDPYRDRAKAEQLAKQFAIDRLNLVIVHSGLRHKYLSDVELAQYDYTAMDVSGQPAIKAFLGEEALTSALLSVTQATQPLVWVTTGHGEKAVTDLETQGLVEFKTHLERANMQVEPVTLLEKTEVPHSVNALIIAGPTRRFVEQEISLLDAYAQGGGRILALLDPLHETGLEALLLRWGVEVGSNIVVDPARQLPFVSAANLFVTDYTQHPIVEKMQTLMTLFPLARSVQGVKDATDVTITPLALTSPQGWGETQPDVRPFQLNEGTDIRGPISIAIAAERLPAPAEGRQAGLPAPSSETPQPQSATPSRLVVIGDSDFVSNSQLSNVGNLDFALGCLNWLVAQEQLIGIGPKPLESIRLHFTGAQMTGIFWFSFAGLPLIYLLFGVGMWWVRRR